MDHGFGYKTRYAHLSRMDVKVGDTVQRGDKIGGIGNTGRSKGNHLHYEVIYRNNKVNPLNYFNVDMNEDEYQAMISMRNSGDQENERV